MVVSGVSGRGFLAATIAASVTITGTPEIKENRMADLDRFLAGADIARAATSRRIGREVHQQDIDTLIAGYAAACRMLAPLLAEKVMSHETTDDDPGEFPEFRSVRARLP